MKRTLKLNVQGLQLSVTGDDFWKLVYTGNDRNGNHYEVIHEAPFNFGAIANSEVINWLIKTVLSEAAQLHG